MITFLYGRIATVLGWVVFSSPSACVCQHRLCLVQRSSTHLLIQVACQTWCTASLLFTGLGLFKGASAKELLESHNGIPALCRFPSHGNVDLHLGHHTSVV